MAIWASGNFTVTAGQIVYKFTQGHPLRCLFCVSALSVLAACSSPPQVERSTAPALLAATLDDATLPTLPDCLHGATPAIARVLRITDGDTVVLDDQRRVRIIGINTLEMDAPAAPDRAFAQAATEALEQLIADQPVAVIIGREPADRYGRTLAHIQLANGKLASDALISQGLGLAVAVGRNTRCVQSLFNAEHGARSAKMGIWQQPGNWFLNATDGPVNARGFHLVYARVQQIVGHGKRQKLLLNNGLQVALGWHWPSDYHHNNPALETLLDQPVEVRGWLGSSKGNPTLTLHHPANLRQVKN